MSYLTTIEPEAATDTLQETYQTLREMFGVVPSVFVAQSLRPDLLEPLVLFVKRLMIEDHELTRTTKELIATYVSKLNACAYWIDAHSAMAMAQGLSRDDVQSILVDVKSSNLIDEKTRALLVLAEKVTKNAYKVTESDIRALRRIGLSDGALLEAILVMALFSYMDRVADATGTPAENFQAMVEQQMAGSPSPP